MEDMLKSRNFKLASRCSTCFEEEESVDHLFVHPFVHCRMVSTLWHLSLSLMGFRRYNLKPQEIC